MIPRTEIVLSIVDSTGVLYTIRLRDRIQTGVGKGDITIRLSSAP